MIMSYHSNYKDVFYNTINGQVSYCNHVLKFFYYNYIDVTWLIIALSLAIMTM